MALEVEQLRRVRIVQIVVRFIEQDAVRQSKMTADRKQLDLKSGEVVWQRDTAKEWTVPSHFFGAGCTPILEGGLLIVLVGGQPNSGVVALDPETGQTKWKLRQFDVSDAGMLTTASDLLFTGGREGHFMALV